MRIRQMEWEREEWSFLVVGAVERRVLAVSMKVRNSFAVVGVFSSMPTSCMVPKASSFTVMGFRSLRRSGMCVSVGVGEKREREYRIGYCLLLRRHRSEHLSQNLPLLSQQVISQVQ